MGATAFMYEGAPNWPEPDVSWDIIERHRGEHARHRATAIRAFIKCGEQCRFKHDLSRCVCSELVGETNQSRSVDVVSPDHWEMSAVRFVGYVVADWETAQL